MRSNTQPTRLSTQGLPMPDMAPNHFSETHYVNLESKCRKHVYLIKIAVSSSNESSDIENRTVRFMLCAKTTTVKGSEGQVYYHYREAKEPLHFDGQYNQFHLTIYHLQKRVSFGLHADILITPEEMRGFGLGSYCMSLLIEYLQTKYPLYTVNSGFLSRGDAETAEAQGIRDNFYRNLGFDVIVDEVGHGKFSATNSMSLKTNFSDKVQIIDALQVSNELYNSQRAHKSALEQNERFEKEVARLNKTIDDGDKQKRKYQQIALAALIVAIFSFVLR
jgi:GNAT superfamily N-acetyltransferase